MPRKTHQIALRASRIEKIRSVKATFGDRMLASMWKLLVQKKYFCSWMNVFNVICQDTVRKPIGKSFMSAHPNMIFWFLRTKKHNREIVLVERNFIDRGFYNGVRARCDEVWSSTGGKWFECGNTLFSFYLHIMFGCTDMNDFLNRFANCILTNYNGNGHQ